MRERTTGRNISPSSPSPRRIRDKYEAEFRELEHSEKQTKERYNQMKSQLTEVEGLLT